MIGSFAPRGRTVIGETATRRQPSRRYLRIFGRISAAIRRVRSVTVFPLTCTRDGPKTITHIRLRSLADAIGDSKREILRRDFMVTPPWREVICVRSARRVVKQLTSSRPSKLVIGFPETSIVLTAGEKTMSENDLIPWFTTDTKSVRGSRIVFSC